MAPWIVGLLQGRPHCHKVDKQSRTHPQCRVRAQLYDSTVRNTTQLTSEHIAQETPRGHHLGSSGQLKGKLPS